MTWNETHERTRILRHAAEAATADMTGAIPWRAEWTQYFDGPAGLVKALRSRLEGMLSAQVDDHSLQDLELTFHQIRQSQAGIVAILKAGASPERLLQVPPPPVVEPQRPHFWQGRGGAYIPSALHWS